MKKLFLIGLMALLAAANVCAADLYKVAIRSAADAEMLKATGAEAVVAIRDGYLALANQLSSAQLEKSGLEWRLLVSGIERGELAVDFRHDSGNVGRYAMLYEEDQLRLYRVAPATLQPTTELPELLPVSEQPLPIKFRQEQELTEKTVQQLAGLQSAIALIKQDSLTAYVNHLQSFYRRAAGTASNLAARDWMLSKFESFGYDSVWLDPFTATIGGSPKTCYNVVACKVGATDPTKQIVIGAHFDGVSSSPAADDNGSGTAGVLEMARVLANLQTEMTFIFACFDAEEYGLYGSFHYAAEASSSGDNIVYMLNMDMIAYIPNTNRAKLYHGSSTTYSQLWISLAAPLVGITGTLSGSTSGSDHYPFTQYGWPVTFVHEYVFSGVYHSARDSTTYMNFPYMTLLVQASLATVCQIGATDLDGDGIPNNLDDCVLTYDPDQIDSDGDAVGNVCDNCPTVSNSDQADSNHDGIGDACEFVCGDADGSDVVNVTDAVYLIAYIFGEGPAPDPLTRGEVDCNGMVNITDVVFLVAYVFGGGAAPCSGC